MADLSVEEIIERVLNKKDQTHRSKSQRYNGKQQAISSESYENYQLQVENSVLTNKVRQLTKKFQGESRVRQSRKSVLSRIEEQTQKLKQVIHETENKTKKLSRMRLNNSKLEQSHIPERQHCHRKKTDAPKYSNEICACLPITLAEKCNTVDEISRTIDQQLLECRLVDEHSQNVLREKKQYLQTLDTLIANQQKVIGNYHQEISNIKTKHATQSKHSNMENQSAQKATTTAMKNQGKSSRYMGSCPSAGTIVKVRPVQLAI